VSSRRDRRAGFTFLEIAIVMVIIAMASALALPMIEGGFDSREVRRAAPFAIFRGEKSSSSRAAAGGSWPGFSTA